MLRNSASIIFLLLMSPSVLAENGQELPEKLFGITLGGVYNIGVNGLDESGMPNIKSIAKGDLPIKKIIKVKDYANYGYGLIRIFFQPNKEYKEFQYQNYTKLPWDSPLASLGITTPAERPYPYFSIKMLPIVSHNVTSLKELGKTSIPYKVVEITWGEFFDNKAVGIKRWKNEANAWAEKFCTTLKYKFPVKPYGYGCIAVEMDRGLTVLNTPGKTFTLYYLGKEKKLSNTLREKIAKLKAKEIKAFD